MTSKEYYYHIKKRLTLNHIVLAVAVFITVLGVWNTVQTLQRNFALQRQVNELDQQIAIAELETQTLALQQYPEDIIELPELAARYDKDGNIVRRGVQPQVMDRDSYFS